MPASARLDDLDTVRVGIYMRRSTDDEHQPYSIETQDDRLESLVESQSGWEVAPRFTDDASGATSDRDDLQRALNAARTGMMNVLLVYQDARFSRNLRDMVTLLDELDQCGVAFRSTTEPFDTSTPMSRMLVQMLGMFAQFERDTIIDRMINGRGHRTTTGGTWSAYQVLRVLSNRIYIGELTFREITVDDCHTPLVDTETFEEAQRLLAERGEDHAHRHATGADYQLTGLMRCPKCGKAMIDTHATSTNKVYRHYTCLTRSRYDTAKCDGHRLNANAAETAVLDALAGFYRDHHTPLTPWPRHSASTTPDTTPSKPNSPRSRPRSPRQEARSTATSPRSRTARSKRN